MLIPEVHSQQRAQTRPAGASSARAELPAEDTLPIGGAEGAAAGGAASPAAAAAGDAAPAPEPSPAPLISVWDFLRMVLVLAVVVGLIYGLFHLLKKGQGRRIVENERIRLIGSRTLSGNRSLHLVQVGGSVFLVGAAEGGVTLISELKDKETVDQVKLESARDTEPSARSFASVLAGLFRPSPRDTAERAAPGGRAPGGEGAAVDYMKRQQERLKRM